MTIEELLRNHLLTCVRESETEPSLGAVSRMALAQIQELERRLARRGELLKLALHTECLHNCIEPHHPGHTDLCKSITAELSEKPGGEKASDK